MTLQDLNKRASDYVYEHVTSYVLSRDMNFGGDAPRPGERLPEFDLPTTDGRRFRTADVLGHKPLLLIMGSLTCPMTASSNPMLKELHAHFGDRIQFAMLHVREAHPGERREQPRSFDEKMQHARDLKRRDDLPWPVIVDDPDGRVHRAFDEKPNAAYLTDETGTIVFRALWAGDETGLRRALEHVARGERPSVPESRRRLAPMGRGIGMMREMTLRSGPRAQADLWRAAPPIAAVAWLADQYRPLPPLMRTVAAAATIAAGIAAVAVLTARSVRHR